MADRKVFVTADHHFGDKDMLLYEDRPFRNVEEMDEAMIRRWNSVVGEDDLVWHLGDFCGGGPERCRQLLQQLKGHKRLVMGNHDRYLTLARWRSAGFEECYDYPVIFRDYFILSHEPLYTCPSMPYANLFGHVHSMPVYRTYSPRGACVCVERHEYTPILIDHLRDWMIEASRQEAQSRQ